jgi:4-amino-4-deoxy-L-arabinose transferase-like glycosyltransferase
MEVVDQPLERSDGMARRGALASTASSHGWEPRQGSKQLSLVDRTSPTVAVRPDSSVDGEDSNYETRPSGARSRAVLSGSDSRFWLCVLSAVALGAVIRLTYLFHAAPTLVWGDGFDYHHSAHRLADGLGYTGVFDNGAEYAHHPPGWVTLLAGITELGGRSMRAHQVTGLVIGLGVILVAGLVGRRYAGHRVGAIAACLAAAYPGFWVLDVQILSEPLGLLILGVLMLVLADLWERPTLARSVLAGAVVGALALVRGEELALLAIAVAPILLLNRRLEFGHRLARAGVATLVAAALLAPWTIHNLGRFEEPVVLSTNGGSTLLSGNCPPATYEGELLGSYDITCVVGLHWKNPELDRSEMDIESRGRAFDNMRDNVNHLPATVLARYGRLLGVFRPAQTVDFVGGWLGSATWPVWAWVTSFWLLAPLAVYGSVLMRRSRRFQWPLVAPVVITLLVTTIAFGDPRYHTMCDLGLVVLAAVAVERLVRRRRDGARPSVVGRAAP